MRVETYSDLYFLDVVNLVRQFHTEAVGEYDPGFNADALIETIKSEGAANPGNCFLMIVDGTCQGILYGARLKSVVSGKEMFQEVIWYVNETHRRHGVRLLREVENTLQSQGVSIMIMAVLENSKTEKLKDFYERIGYKKIETHYSRIL